MPNLSKLLVLSWITLTIGNSYAQRSENIATVTRIIGAGAEGCHINLGSNTKQDDEGPIFVSRLRAHKISNKEDLAALKELKEIAKSLSHSAQAYNFSPDLFNDYVNKTYRELRMPDELFYSVSSSKSLIHIWSLHTDPEDVILYESSIKFLRDCEIKRFVELVDKICDSTAGHQKRKTSIHEEKFFSSERSCKI